MAGGRNAPAATREDSIMLYHRLFAACLLFGLQLALG